MKSLVNIKKAPLEIGQLLSQNAVFCSLLVDDSGNPQSVSKSFEKLVEEKYITVYPPVTNGNLEDKNRNSYCIILLDSINVIAADSNVDVTGNIYVITDLQHVLLSNNRNRLLELADQVYQTLNEQKITAAGEIHINYINYITIDDYHIGYRISFTFSDQQSRKAEI